MDIRSAKRTGVIPPMAVADDPGTPKVPTVSEETGQVELPYDGNPIIQEYMKFLEKHDVSEDSIRQALEVLITSGTLSWKFLLFDRIPVEFHARPAWVDNYIIEVLDRTDSKISNVHFNNIVAECNLAASLYKYGDEVYQVTNEEELKEAVNRVRNLTYIIQNALVNKLAVFDRTIAVATSDWAIKNFIKPQQEKLEQN